MDNYIKMKKKAKLTLIILLLIAVAAASVGILKIHKAGAAGSDLKQAENQIEQEAPAEDDSGGPPPDQLLATIFFASDYQAEEGFDAPADTLRAILGSAKADGKSIDRVVMCGDYTNDPKLHDYQLSPEDSIAEIREVVREELGSSGGEADSDTEAGAEIMFVQGNHDSLTESIDSTGLHDCGDYLIYVLNTEEDFPWKQGKVSGCLAKVRKSSAAMKECFDELIEKGETRPVFIAGHVPLQFTARTSSRHTTGDNLYSSLVFDVVNDAAKDLDIFYLFGHDHSKGWDCYLGGSCVYKAKGDSLLVPEFDEMDINTDTYSEKVLNFTYLNAGYVGYYMNCGPDENNAGLRSEYSAADETLTGTVFEVYGDRVVITRYDGSGVHALGSEGEGDPYKGGIDAGLIDEGKYSNETASPQTIARK